MLKYLKKKLDARLKKWVATQLLIHVILERRPAAGARLGLAFP